MNHFYISCQRRKPGESESEECEMMISCDCRVSEKVAGELIRDLYKDDVITEIKVEPVDLEPGDELEVCLADGSTAVASPVASSIASLPLAVAELYKALGIAEHNAAIFRAEGNEEEAFARDNTAAELRQALALLEGGAE